jgi:hypothetical protein
MGEWWEKCAMRSERGHVEVRRGGLVAQNAVINQLYCEPGYKGLETGNLKLAALMASSEQRTEN